MDRLRIAGVLVDDITAIVCLIEVSHLVDFDKLGISVHYEFDDGPVYSRYTIRGLYWTFWFEFYSYNAKFIDGTELEQNEFLFLGYKRTLRDWKLVGDENVFSTEMAILKLLL